MNTIKTPNFDEVAGYKEVKEELKTIFSWYFDKELQNNKDIFLPTGILFYGSPGNGKTLFMREYIKAFQVPTFLIKGKDHQIDEIHSAFEKARQEKLAIIVIDELDMLISNKKDVERVLQSELDGINKKGQILVLATTNRLLGISDALKRQGRFDRIILIGKPDKESRVEIFKHYLSKLHIDINSIDIDYLCRVCALLSGAEIKSLINDAYLRNKGGITTKDLEDAYDRIRSGDFVKDNPLDYKDYNCAIHEAGHVVMALKYREDFRIYSTKFVFNGGITKTYPLDEKRMDRIKNIIAIMQVSLSGALAEHLFFKTHDTGLSDDLEKTYRIAKELVERVCDKKFISFTPHYHFEYDRSDTNVHKLKNERRIQKVIYKQSKFAYRYLKKHKNDIKLIADALYDKGQLTYQEIYEILNIDIPYNVAKPNIFSSNGVFAYANNKRRKI